MMVHMDEETYTSAVERIRARNVAKGMPPSQALNAAEKQASARRKAATPGQRGRKINRRNNFKKGTDPVPPKEKKKRHEDIKQYASDLVMEIHGITGLIGAGMGPVGPVSGGSDPGSSDPSSKGTALSQKYNQQEPDDVTKKSGKGKSAPGFKASAGRKFSVKKPPAGTLTKGPDTINSRSINKVEDIEKEFGIV